MNAAVGEALLRISLSLNYLNGYCWMNIYLRPEIILFNRIRTKKYRVAGVSWKTCIKLNGMYVWCKFSFTICNINRLGADKWCVCASVPITFNFTYQHVFMASYFIVDNMYWYTLELGSDWYCSFRKCTKLKYFICSSCQLLSFLVKFFSSYWRIMESVMNKLRHNWLLYVNVDYRDKR